MNEWSKHGKFNLNAKKCHVLEMDKWNDIHMVISKDKTLYQYKKKRKIWEWYYRTTYHQRNINYNYND